MMSFKATGEMIIRAEELMKKEKQIEGGSRFVQFSAARTKALGYLMTGQANKGVEILDEFIPQIPDTPEYNLVKSSLLNVRGFCYANKNDFERAKEDYQNAIVSAKKTVDDKTKGLGVSYCRLGECYRLNEDWDMALVYFEKAMPGFETATFDDRAFLYYAAGNTCWELNEYEKAKGYLLKAYVYKWEVKEDLGPALSKDYGSTVKESLYKVYELEKGEFLFFDEWLEKELDQMEAEEAAANSSAVEKGNENGVGGYKNYIFEKIKCRRWDDSVQ